MQPFQISASLLAADFARLGEESSQVIQAGADILHIDVMDNHYVPNLTVGPLLCKALRHYGITAPLDVHLMVKPVDRIISDFATAGATHLIFHPEASEHVDRTLQLIRDVGCRAGLALNPSTPLDCLDYVLHKIDRILIMSVNPGFGGQSFIPTALTKIKAVRRKIDESGLPIRLEVDGGINVTNLKQIAEAGADTFVMGTAIFSQPNYAAAIKAMRKVMP